MLVRCGHLIGLVVLVATALPCSVHYVYHGKLSLLHFFLNFFCSLNLLICLWELALFYCFDTVQRDYMKLREKFPDTTSGRFGAINECVPFWRNLLHTRRKLLSAQRRLLFTPMSRRNVVAPKFWCKIWSTYALYDPSYADRRSWGFWIDVGNGHSTLLPSVLWLIGSTFHVMPARSFGLVGLIAFYQELYGTLVYFASFLQNCCHHGKSAFEVVLFVGLTNGIWVVGPLVGCYAAVRLVYSDKYDLFYIA